jgi:hypothetical protein
MLSRRLFRMFFAAVGLLIGWWLGAPLGELAAFALSILGVAIGFYVANRLLAQLLG